jgi:hypothetical protein
MPASIASTFVVHLFVGENRAKCGAPVDGHVVDVSEALPVDDAALLVCG